MNLPRASEQGQDGIRTVFDVALVGNPNAGKTSIFNALTGLHQKVANYPGVTVEKKTGEVATEDGNLLRLHDLPGLYSLVSRSPDDGITVDVLTRRLTEPANLDCVLVLVDANNLSRGLYLVTQILDLGLPVVIALNMIDTAKTNGIEIDASSLAEQLGVPVIPTVAHAGEGIPALKKAVLESCRNHTPPPAEHQTRFNETIHHAIGPVVDWFDANNLVPAPARASEAMRVVSNNTALTGWEERPGSPAGLRSVVDVARTTLEESGIPWKMLDTRTRYSHVDEIVKLASIQSTPGRENISERLDRVLTHKFAGPAIFVLIFAVMFQSVFSWAEIPMNAIESGIAWLGQSVASMMPDGLIESLVVDGVINGVGAILVFLPQILFLFFFLSLLEESGYMARIAFIVDKVMKGAGLSGRSVIPLLSSFACAVPGIMATRTIQDQRSRLITILIAPLMSCSARLPVYTLMIAALVPTQTYFGVFSLAGLTLLGLYMLGILAAAGAAIVFRKTLLRGRKPSPFVLELPAYRMPSMKSALYQMMERAKIFLKDAGGIILAISIVLWFLATFPQTDVDDNLTPSQHLEQSYAGQIGQTIEPVIEPLGFDWKIGIGLITSFAAREVMVATLATIYNVENGDENSTSLRDALRNEINPKTGKPRYTPLVALALMVFFVLACQCMATVAVVKRETNSWFWPLLMIAYMTALAYLGALFVYQGGLLLGYS